MTDNPSCILCDNSDSEFYWEDQERTYYQCTNCNLVFVPERFWLDPEEEKSRYDLHENDPEDEGYRHFLGHLFHPLNDLLPDTASGLDFGSGPGPTLSLMFEEAGHQVALYDPFYAQNPSVFDQQYDFITATEVIEHLNDPLHEIDRLWSCLTDGGYLGIMTQLVINKSKFANWHYKDDDTHVAFYSRETFHWLANHLSAELKFLPKNVMILMKLSY